MMVFDQTEFFLLALILFPIYLWRHRQQPVRQLIFRAVFFTYLAGVVSQTLFPINLVWEWGLAGKDNHIELTLFQYFVWRDAILNVLFTLPFGLLYPFVTRHSWPRTLMFGLLIPVVIEVSQLILLYTTFDYSRVVDVSDVLFNFIGLVIGYLIYRMLVGKNRR